MPTVGHNRGLETPAQEARSVSASWRESVGSLLDACDRIYRVLDAFEQDEDRQGQFIAGLVKGGVITVREGRLGLGSPKLSKLRTIGQHADILRRRDIAGVTNARVFRAVSALRTLQENTEPRRKQEA